MAQHIEKLAILFADICDETSPDNRHDNEPTRRMATACIKAMSRETTAFRGMLVRSTTTEIMCMFPGAEYAMRAACAMQRAIKNDRVKGNCPAHIRIGFHYGDVVCEAGDVYGETVNIAARVAAITHADQITTTADVVNALQPSLRDKTHQIVSAEFKKKQDRLDIFQVDWDDSDTSQTLIATPAQRKPQNNTPELALDYRGHSFKVNERQRNIILGRDNSCGIVINSNFASRQHARIELRFGKFVVSDQSTNGTYIRFSDGFVIRTSHEDVILHGSGSISLGQTYAENPTELVEFAVVDMPS